MARFDEIKEYLESLDDDDLFSVFREYTTVSGDWSSEVFLMYEFDDIMEARTPTEIVNKVFYGKGFSPRDTYFAFDGYDNLFSFDYLDDPASPVYIDEMAEYIVDSDDDLGYAEIREILDSEDEEDKEDGDDL